MPRPRSARPTRKLLQSDFNLGGQQAETDSLFQEAFFETGHYRTVVSREDRRCILVGRTGSGKSAILRKIQQDYPFKVIRINPEDLSLPYITDLGVVRYLSSLNVHMDPLFIALWKHVLLIEIIKHRYKVDSQDAKQRFMANLMERIKRDRSKRVALEYLEEFEGKFWCETDERVKEITRKFENSVKTEAGGKLSTPLGGLSAMVAETGGAAMEDRAELIQRFQRLVNDTQLPRLNKMMTVLDEDILDSPQYYTYILIDDLDRDWVDEKVANDLIRCLFRAVHDLIRVQNLKILVALRTNIFETLDFGITGGQEEKFRDLTLRVRWTRGDLDRLLSERTRAAAAKHGLGGFESVADLLPRADKAHRNALDTILQKTLMRPRDAIAFMNECLELASGSHRITWDVIQAAEESYSSNRLLALRDEWKPTYPGIERVLRMFTGVPTGMDVAELVQRLDRCILLSVEAGFPGAQWMTDLGNPALDPYGSNDWAEMYQPLIRMLYSIGFIGYSLGKKYGETYSYDEPDFMDKPGNIRAIERFAVHPAFRQALDIS